MQIILKFVCYFPASLTFQIHDKDFSVTLNAFFVVRWQDTRLVMDQDKIINNLKPGTLT